MNTFNLERLNKRREELGEKPIDVEVTIGNVTKKLESLEYKELDGKGTKGDVYTKEMLHNILQNGTYDNNPRPYYEDKYSKEEVRKYDERKGIIILKNGRDIELSGRDKIYVVENEIIVHSPAHSISINSPIPHKYNLAAGESPMSTFRPQAEASAVAEDVWIYGRQSNDLVVYDELLGYNDYDGDPKKIHNWWLQWAVVDAQGNYVLNEKGNPIIGKCYGGTTGPRNMFNDEVIETLMKDPDSRRIMCSLWQVDDFKQPHGLKPCAFLTIWNVRHEWDGKDYLDMNLIQRSSDFCVASTINQFQYAALQTMVAKQTDFNCGVFTWSPVNVQIYDRHIGGAIEMLNRDPVICDASLKLDPNFKDLKSATKDSVKALDSEAKQLIKKINPQIKFQLGI